MKQFLFTLSAAITFFTKLPVWKFVNIPSDYFKRIIYLWPLTGWITGGIMAGAYLGFIQIFPPTIAIVLALALRTLFTGGLHEDGLGDFFDGFGGRTKTDILRIMKDSHTGSYALTGLIFYYLLLVNSLKSIPTHLVVSVMVVADPLSKMMTALMMNTLPYARAEEESKVKTVFNKTGIITTIALLFFGLFPLVWELKIQYWSIALLPVLTVVLMRALTKKRIGGYTGDICGATALLCELSFYLATAAIMNN